MIHQRAEHHCVAVAFHVAHPLAALATMAGVVALCACVGGAGPSVGGVKIGSVVTALAVAITLPATSAGVSGAQFVWLCAAILLGALFASEHPALVATAPDFFG